MPPISVLLKPSSSNCNMSCDYCFYCDEAMKRTHRSYGFMSDQTLKNVIRRTMLRADRMISYAFQGGEPTLSGLDFFQKVIAYQQQYNKNHIQIKNAFQTNGYHLDEQWCRFFKENDFLVGISVDGTEAIHNSMRHARNGGDTYSQIMHSVGLLDEYAVDYNILTVVTSAIADSIRPVYEHYKARGWNYQQYIVCLEPLGEEHGGKSYAISPEQYGRFMIELFHLWYQDLKSGTQPFIRQLENIIGLSLGYQAEACDQRGNCGIQYVVEADGSVYPCDFYVLDDYCLGNFNTDSLTAIDKRREESGFIKRSYQLDRKCSECRYYRLCRGGCQRNRDYDPETGRYSNYYCLSYQIFFEACYDEIMDIGRRLRPPKTP